MSLQDILTHKLSSLNPARHLFGHGLGFGFANGKHGAHPQQHLESGYGSAHLHHAPSHGPLQPQRAYGLGARRQLNSLSLFMALVVPFALFAVTFYVMSFELFYRHPKAALLVVFSAFLFTLVLGVFSLQAKRTENLDRTLNISPPISQYGSATAHGQRTWLYFVFTTSLMACFLGSTLGYANMTFNAVRYYDYISLRKATNVTPGEVQGQVLLDAGEVDFKAGTKIDVNMNMLWHKAKTWCIAPIVAADGGKLASYDFWAVGMDCCSARRGDFSCSQTTPGAATAGLRVMDNAEIAGYKLAVEQASAAYNIQSRRPIFLHMMDTPYLKIKAYFNDAKDFAVLSGVCFLIMQIVLVASQAYTFGRHAPSGSMDVHKTSKHFFH